MGYTKLPGDFEVELPGEWPPCEVCESTVRVAIATLSHRGLGFLCGNLHRTPWFEDDGSEGIWIKHHHFWPKGQFHGLIPEHFVGVPKAADANRRFEINERRRDWIHSQQSSCAVCGIPPLRDYHDGKKLLFWLKDFHPSLFDDVVAFINVINPRPIYATLIAALIREKPNLFGEIVRKYRDSFLQADHSIPKAVLSDLWKEWDRPMRTIGLNTLAFGYCRPDNNGKSKRLPSNEELVRLHVQLNCGGSERAARESIEQWGALQRVLLSLDRYRLASGQASSQ